MAFYTEEQIKAARSIDLLTYLQTYEPTELIHVRGDTYCTREHDSLKISNGKWMWWSRGFGGTSALDYLVKVKGMQFTDAMKILIDNSEDFQNVTPKICSKDNRNAERKLLLPEKSETNREVIKYLTGRGIDRDLIDACIHRGVLFESLPYHNCVFVGFDEHGIAKYASYRSTNELRLMGEAAGSDKRYSFRTNADGRNLHVFESAIDLLSYMTVIHEQTGRWIADPMISLGGVYAPGSDKTICKLPVALENMLQNHPEVETISLHLDNDFAGRSATENISLQLRCNYKTIDEPPPVGKDYNDYLMALCQQGRSRKMGAARYDCPR
ncbi:MAG: DUF3991 and TOPRIM domain-containing protein [Mogibacterium sp.]|jgi:hypothetical protein|nr:DUF3991 and TOPRIM domain-containing protein [Oscillospiraceae bacterium]MBR3199974.1 DUF3991 and TOPRIM domain-containing protein [Mogibacterium sp.]MEE1169199.1 DUF3991 and TOPRIM domain-containing protein [Anaerovoracaceae bacterium]